MTTKWCSLFLTLSNMKKSRNSCKKLFFFFKIGNIWKKQPIKVFYKKEFLSILHNWKENTCIRPPFLIELQAWNFIKKETPAQVFSCDFYKIFENTFFIKHFQVHVLLFLLERPIFLSFFFLTFLMFSYRSFSSLSFGFCPGYWVINLHN